jgi:serine/threonine-protein kinase
VTREGKVKVLDFGLAKVLSPVSDESPTQTRHTEPLVLMGTPAYMSPEQVRGEVVGRQSDIWSFGVLLYEMLAGVSPFARNTTAETLARVVESEPDFSLLSGDVPDNVRRLVRRCLEKDSRRRAQHMGDVRLELEDGLAVLAMPSASVTTPVKAQPKIRRTVLLAATVVFAALSGLGGWFLAGRSGSSADIPPIRLFIPFPQPPAAQPFGIRTLAISDDGSRVAYASSRRLWIRRLDQNDPTGIETDTALDPFFSPDGRWVGFYSLGLLKVPAEGGSPIRIAMSSERPAGAAWGADGTIVFADTEGLHAVSENGGDVRLLVTPDRQRRERLYAWPSFLPDGQSFLFTILSEGSEPAQIALFDLKTLQLRVLFTGGTAARYVSSGHLVFASGSLLKAISFDANRGQVSGDAITVSDVEVATRGDNGAADFAVSKSGTLVFLPPLLPTGRILEWIDRQGKREPVAIRPGPYNYPRVSPDGTRIALDLVTSVGRDIWILSLDRMSLTQLTDGPTEDMLPQWSLDGRRLYFASDRTGNFDVYSQAADGASPARLEFAGPGLHALQSFSPDGTLALVYENFRDTGVLELATPDRLKPLLSSAEFDERLAQFSPDGKWIAYESDESGNQVEIFIRPFPDVGGRREKVSIDGGRYPHWGREASNELFYVNLNGDMMSVSVTLTPELKIARATKLFAYQKPPAGRSGMPYDISPRDGRFVVTSPAQENPVEPTSVSVVLHWIEELLRQRR